jgi:imidazolonepropionase-like amidohydrolase
LWTESYAPTRADCQVFLGLVRRRGKNFAKAPTISKSWSQEGVSSPSDPPESLQFTEEEIKAAVVSAANWGKYVARALSESTLEKNKKVLDCGLRSLEILRGAGVQIGFGTDLLGALQIEQSREFLLRSGALGSGWKVWWGGLFSESNPKRR